MITFNFEHLFLLNQIHLKVFTRALNRLKYRSGLGSAKLIFSGFPTVQIFRRLILKVQLRIKLKILRIFGFRFDSGSQKQEFKDSNLVWFEEFETVNSTYVLFHSYGRFFKKNYLLYLG